MKVTSKGLTKGAWTVDEDNLLKHCVDQYGEGKWHQVPIRAGLNRCRKSCRLRWLNYLKPNIKRGKLCSDEVDLLLRLHKLLGNRWSLIAGRLPGRTANDVKNYWNTHLRKKEDSSTKTKTRKIDSTSNCVTTPTTKIDVIKPRPRSFINGSSRLDLPSQVNLSPHCVSGDGLNSNKNNNEDNNVKNNVCEDEIVNKESLWWESLLEETEEEDGVERDGTLTEKTCLMKSTSASFDVDQLWSLFDIEETEDLN